MADNAEMMDLGRSVFNLIADHFDRDPTGETTINGKCGVALVAFIRSALHPTPTPVSAPVGVEWRQVPAKGALVKADHPITVLNPSETFEVLEIKVDERGEFFARGENTMWFNTRMLSAALRSPAVEGK